MGLAVKNAGQVHARQLRDITYTAHMHDLFCIDVFIAFMVGNIATARVGLEPVFPGRLSPAVSPCACIRMHEQHLN